MTRLTILAVARRAPGWIQTGFNEYNKRLPQELKIDVVEVPPARRGGNRSLEKPLLAEAEAIFKHLPKHSLAIALDENGKAHTTMQLATCLDGWMKGGINPCFIIGGADGLHSSITKAVAETWSLSKFTLPHALVRVLLAEQIYRAWCILRNHPYHRE